MYKRQAVGDEVRQPGDLIPEAQDWPYVAGLIQDGKIAPVLVATLPEDTQVMLLDWEEETYGAAAVQEIVEPEDEEEAEESNEDAEADSEPDEEPAEADKAPVGNRRKVKAHA